MHMGMDARDLITDYQEIDIEIEIELLILLDGESNL